MPVSKIDSFEHPFFRGDALQLRAMGGAWVPALVIFMEMRKIVAMTVPVSAMRSQITPR
jgi:hypothetical protein